MIFFFFFSKHFGLFGCCVSSGEGFPMAVKREADEDDELESVPFSRRLGMAVGRVSFLGYELASFRRCWMVGLVDCYF